MSAKSFGVELKAHFYFSEDELGYLMSFIPNDDKILRPRLQAGGENIFGWK